MAPNTTMSHLEQFNGSASQGENTEGEMHMHLHLLVQVIPVIKAAILKTYSYKVQTSYKFIWHTQRQET